MKFKLIEQAEQPKVKLEEKPSFTQQAFDTAMSLTPFGMARELYGVARDPAGAVQTLDDTARLAASGLSFGFIDKLAGRLGGKGTEAERMKTEDARRRQGLRGAAVEIGGSVLPAARLAQAGVTAMRLPWAGPLLGGAIDGAGYGALTAAGNDKPIGEGAAYGAGFGLLGQYIGKGIEKGHAAFNKPPVPELDDLIAQKNAAYGQVDASGAQYTPDQLAALRQGIADDMAAGRMHPAINPKVAAVNDIVGEDLARGPMTLSELDRTRQVVGNKIFQNAPTADDARLGGQMLQNFDEFIDATPPAMGGDNAAVVDALKKARELNRRISKTELLEDALVRAERQTAATGSGGNIDNATRQKINAILNNKNQARKFSDEEKALMEALVKGTGAGNTLRLAGKLSPSGSGLMAALGIGGAMANPLFGIPALAGIGAKAAADRSTQRMAEKLLASVKTGGNYQSPPMSPQTRQMLENMIRAAVMGGTVTAVQGNR